MLTILICTYIIHTMATVKIQEKLAKFEWDSGNLDKSYLKHGILPKEAEEIFLCEESLVIEDIKHSQKEERFIIIGQTLDQKNMFVVFTIRKDKIRVISARRMHKNELRKYEKTKR